MKMKLLFGSSVILLALIAFMMPAKVIAAEKPLEKVTIQLKWFHQFQFAGYYAAKEKGFYAEEGLDMVLRGRDVSTTPVGDVLAGKAEYGITDADLLIDRVQGRPVVLLAQILQQSPNILISMAESAITNPQDLTGKKAAFFRPSARQTLPLPENMAAPALG